MCLNKVCVIFVVMEQRVQLSVAGSADNCELPNVDAVNWTMWVTANIITNLQVLSSASGVWRYFV